MASFNPQQGYVPGPSPSSEDMIYFQKEHLRLHQLNQQQATAQQDERRSVSPTQYQPLPSGSLQQARPTPTAVISRAWDTLQSTLGQSTQLAPQIHLQQSENPSTTVHVPGDPPQSLVQQMKIHAQRFHAHHSAAGQEFAHMTAEQYWDNIRSQKPHQEQQLAQSMNESSPQPTILQPRPVQQHALPQAPPNRKRQPSTSIDQQISLPTTQSLAFQYPQVQRVDRFAKTSVPPRCREADQNLDLAQNTSRQALQRTDSQVSSNHYTPPPVSEGPIFLTSTQTAASSKPHQQPASNGALAHQENGQLQARQDALTRETGHLKRIVELEAALKAMTQERDTAISQKGNTHQLVPVHFSPTAGLSYKFGKDDKPNDCWTCLSPLGCVGPPCNRVNSTWMKMRIPGGGSPVWSERTKCGVCRTMKQDPQQFSGGGRGISLPSPPDCSEGFPPNWVNLNGSFENATSIPVGHGASDFRTSFLQQKATGSEMAQTKGCAGVQNTGRVLFPFPDQINSTIQAPDVQLPSPQSTALPMNEHQPPNMSCNTQILQAGVPQLHCLQHPSASINMAAAQTLPAGPCYGVPQQLELVAMVGQPGQAVLTQGNVLYMPTPIPQEFPTPAGPSTIQAFQTRSGGTADSPLLIEDDETDLPLTIGAGAVAGTPASANPKTTTSQTGASVFPALIAAQSIPSQVGTPAAISTQIPEVALSVDSPVLKVSNIGPATASPPTIQQSDSGINGGSAPSSSIAKSPISNPQILSKQPQVSPPSSAQFNKRPAPQQEETTSTKRQKTSSPDATSSEEPQFEEASAMQSAPIKQKKDLGTLRAEAAKGHFQKVLSSAHRSWMDFPSEAAHVQQTPMLQVSKKRKRKELQSGPRKRKSGGKNTTPPSSPPSLGALHSNPRSVSIMGKNAELEARLFEEKNVPAASASSVLASRYDNVSKSHADGFEVYYGGDHITINNACFSDSGVVADMSSRATPESDASHAARVLGRTLNKMKLPELKRELKLLKLKCVGNKEDLIKRLLENGFTVENSATTNEKMQREQAAERDKDFDLDAFLAESVDQILAEEAAQEEQVAWEEQNFAVDPCLTGSVEQLLADEPAQEEQVTGEEQNFAVDAFLTESAEQLWADEAAQEDYANFDFGAFLTEGFEQHLADEPVQKEQAVEEDEEFDFDAFLNESIEQHLAEEELEEESATYIESDEKDVEDADAYSKMVAQEIDDHAKILATDKASDREDRAVGKKRKQEKAAIKSIMISEELYEDDTESEEDGSDSEDEEHSVG